MLTSVRYQSGMFSGIASLVHLDAMKIILDICELSIDVFSHIANMNVINTVLQNLPKIMSAIGYMEKLMSLLTRLSPLH